MKYYGVVWTYENDDQLEHFGIKGMRWGIRRFQNEDGSYTKEGKERYYKKYNEGVRKGKFDDDPEIRELWMMEQQEIDTNIQKARKPLVSSLTSNSAALSKSDRHLIDKVRNGEELSNKESKNLKEAWKKYMDQNHKLGEQSAALRKKYNVVSDDSLPPDAKKLNNSIADKIAEGRKAMAEVEYASALNEEHEYAKSIRDDIFSGDNKKYVDPAYRSFSSKEEKAKAEAEYMKATWDSDYSELSDKERDRITDEAVHLSHKMLRMSMDGYEGVPKSERNKAMYDYEPRYDSARFDSFDTYEHWIPKYEKTDEWKALQKKRETIYNDPRYKKANEEYDNAVLNNLSRKEIEKFQKAWSEAYNERREELNEIRKEERRIQEPFYYQIAKNVLLDIGYEVTPENIECVFPIVWYD